MTALTTKDQRLADAAATECPLCERSHERDDDAAPAAAEQAIHAAAHCCLWKVASHPVRERIAKRVYTGANWLEALQAEGVA